MRRWIMLIGPTGCGKTTLANAINGVDAPVRRTQDTLFGRYAMDVPGSYMENPWMYPHLISAAQNHAAHILVLTDQATCRNLGAPGFVKVFGCPVTGVVTKADLAPENEDACIKQLERLGVRGPCFRVSVKEKAGMAELNNFLSERGLV